MYKVKEVKLEQTDESNWLAWRDGGIGASESAIIMGALPFKWNDVLELWKLKTKMIESDFQMNEAMLQGKMLEPEARKRFTQVTGLKVRATCYESLDFPFIRASLDGINKKEKTIVEIKCPGVFKFREAKSGKVVDYYYPQIQQQLLCSGAEKAYYWVYREKEGGVLFDVPRNDEYIEELIRRSKIFWEGVENKEPVLPRHLGINTYKESDPFMIGNMECELLDTYKN